MKWTKKGLIFAPDGHLGWARQYATLPTVDVINAELIRVYFAALDEDKFGRIGYVDLDSRDPHRVLHVAEEPILSLGDLGTFDDSGLVPSCILEVSGRKLMYYIGFQRTVRVPYMLFTGLAWQESKTAFVRWARTPILDRTAAEPFSRSAPYVIFQDGSFKMWYWSCTKWQKTANGSHYYNVLRYATSENGVDWLTNAHVCLEPIAPDEYSIGRPSVIWNGSFYKMWFSVRSFTKLYAMGYAESEDGIHWTRKDEEAGIEVSETGWDSEMICYPCVVSINKTLHMFYNGNRHGSTGFGYAVLES
jgi:hypothetical protein